MARATGEDAAAGLPDEMAPAEDVELGLFDPSAAELPTAERIDRARRAEAVALADPGHRQLAGRDLELRRRPRRAREHARASSGGYRSSSVSLSVVPQAGARRADGAGLLVHAPGRGLSDLEAPEDVGRTAAARTLRRLGARQVPTAEVPVVFDPDDGGGAARGTLYSAMSGYAVFRSATFLKGRLGEEVASPLLTWWTRAGARAGSGPRPFDGEGLPTRTNVPLERGVLRYFLCDSYSARKIGARPTGSARRGVAGGPSVGAGNLYFEPGAARPGRSWPASSVACSSPT